MSRASDERLKRYYEQQLVYVANRLKKDKYHERPSVAKPQAFEKRQLIWRHNSFLGHVKMMEKNLSGIARAQTTTPETKSLALDLLNQLPRLAESLKTRNPL